VYSPCWRDIPPREFANYLPDPDPEVNFSYYVHEMIGEGHDVWLPGSRARSLVQVTNRWAHTFLSGKVL